MAKLATWKSRKNQMLGRGWTDVVKCFEGLVTGHLNIEHAFYSLTSNLEAFTSQWGIGQVICSLEEDGSLVLHYLNYYLFIFTLIKVEFTIKLYNIKPHLHFM